MPTKQQRLNEIIRFVHGHTAVKIHLVDHLPWPSDCTWMGIALTAGEIYVNKREHVSLGSVLHEVGHVIGVPLPLRPLMSGSLGTQSEWVEAVAGHEEKHGYLTSISDDGAATFWGCMVLDHLGMPLKAMFEEGLLPEDAAEHLASHKLLFESKVKMPLNGQVRAFYLGLIPTKTVLRPECWDPFAAAA